MLATGWGQNLGVVEACMAWKKIEVLMSNSVTNKTVLKKIKAKHVRTNEHMCLSLASTNFMTLQKEAKHVSSTGVKMTLLYWERAQSNWKRREQMCSVKKRVTGCQWDGASHCLPVCRRSSLMYHTHVKDTNQKQIIFLFCTYEYICVHVHSVHTVACVHSKAKLLTCVLEEEL